MEILKAYDLNLKAYDIQFLVERSEASTIGDEERLGFLSQGETRLTMLMGMRLRLSPLLNCLGGCRTPTFSIALVVACTPNFGISLIANFCLTFN